MTQHRIGLRRWGRIPPIELAGVEKVYKMGQVDYRALRGVDLSIALASQRKSLTDLIRRRARTVFSVLTLAIAVASVSFFAIPTLIDRAMQDEVRAGRLADVTMDMRPLELTADRRPRPRHPPHLHHRRHRSRTLRAGSSASRSATRQPVCLSGWCGKSSTCDCPGTSSSRSSGRSHWLCSCSSSQFAARGCSRVSLNAVRARRLLSSASPAD